MNRRTFLQQSVISAATYSLSSCVDTASASGKTHVISLSFDDGFKKSFNRVAEIHENYGTKACLNVIATGHLPSFKAVDKWILPELMGDFEDWNNLVAKGHEVMPHTWEHKNLTKLDVSDAKDRLDKCFAYFNENLDGYKNENAVYNFAFNASTKELDMYCLETVKAIRTGYWLIDRDSFINGFPEVNYQPPLRLACWFYGPGIGDKKIDKEINRFLKSNGGWLIINLHGLDDEGWGPVTTEYYDGLIKRLAEVPKLDLLPVGQAIQKYSV